MEVLATRKGPQSQVVTGSTWREIEAKVDAYGAIRFEDALGGVYRKLSGEWVFIGQSRKPKTFEKVFGLTT